MLPFNPESLTLQELADRMSFQLEETEIIELLDITSEDLVMSFMDRIEENRDQLLEELEFLFEDDDNHEGDTW